MIIEWENQTLKYAAFLLILEIFLLAMHNLTIVMMDPIALNVVKA